MNVKWTFKISWKTWTQMTVEQRFWESITKKDNGCWDFYHLDIEGYGRL